MTDPETIGPIVPQQPSPQINPGAEPELGHLRALSAIAPPSTFARFRRRAGMVQGTRMLFETQINGFWLVLDTVLKRLLRSDAVMPGAKESSDRQTGDRA